MYFEDNKTELKRELTDDVKREMIAFLNTHGGVIYIGVNDDGTIHEPFISHNRDEIFKKLSSWIQDDFYPLPSTLVRFDFNDDGVLAIEVSEGNNKPYYLRDKGPIPSGVYRRSGTSVRKCSEDEILRMIMNSSHYVFESDISEDQDLTFGYFKRICDERQINTDDKLFLSLGLINSEGKYTNLGLLISDQSPVAVKVAEYDDSMNFKVKKTFTGSLLKVLEDTQEQAERMNDVSAVIDEKSWKRIETHSYPGQSLREIILNAFCHSDFFIRSNIKVEFYKDKTKITSPGGLYNTTLEDILNGVQTYRNERLVHLLDKLGFIENFGTGIPRTIEAYRGTGKQPSFYDSEHFFVVYLPNLNYDGSQDNGRDDQINDQINDQISDTGLAILKIIQSHPGIKVRGIYEMLQKTDESITIDRIRNVIKRQLNGYIKLAGSKKTGGYVIALSVRK